MLDIGFSELVLIGVIALIALGPKQLPEVARTVARFINDMKRTVGEFTGSIVHAREETNRFLNDLDKKPPPRAPAPEPPVPEPLPASLASPARAVGAAGADGHEHHHYRFALAPEREGLSLEEEAERRKQMAFPIFDDQAGARASGIGSGDGNG